MKQRARCHRASRRGRSRLNRDALQPRANCTLAPLRLDWEALTASAAPRRLQCSSGSTKSRRSLRTRSSAPQPSRATSCQSCTLMHRPAQRLLRLDLLVASRSPMPRPLCLQLHQDDAWRTDGCGCRGAQGRERAGVRLRRVGGCGGRGASRCGGIGLHTFDGVLVASGEHRAASGGNLRSKPCRRINRAPRAPYCRR